MSKFASDLHPNLRIRYALMNQKQAFSIFCDHAKNQALDSGDSIHVNQRTQAVILSEFLILDAQHGNQDALAQLVTLWTPKLAQRAYRLTGDSDGANEVVQESWIAIAKGLRSLRDPSRFGGWAYRIVQYKAADWIQQRTKDRDLNSRLHMTAVSQSGNDSTANHTDEIRSAIAQLTPKLREVVCLFYMDQCTIEQISIVLNIPLGTAKTRLSRARSVLKSKLERSIQ